MARYTKTDQFTLGGQNTENEKIETAINDTLSRKGDSPNAMEADLDMNSHRILNLLNPVANKEAATKEYVDQQAMSGATVTVDPEWFDRQDPYDLGAVGDGVTDDTAALQLWAAQKGYLPLPAGNYKITAPIQFSVGSRVVGSGSGVGTSGAGSYTLAELKGEGIATIIMDGTFVGSAGFLFKDDGKDALYGCGIEDVRFFCDGSDADAIQVQQAYDNFYARNINVLNVGDTSSALRMIPNPDITPPTDISQTILIENFMGIHKNSTATESTFYFDQCQEITLIGVKAFAGYQASKPTSDGIELVDCRGVSMVGCSTAHSQSSGILIRTVTRSSDGISIVGHTFENCDHSGLRISGISSVNNVTRVYNRNARYEGQTVAVHIDRGTDCMLDTGIAEVFLDTNSSQNTVYSGTGAVNITNNGTNNVIFFDKSGWYPEYTVSTGFASLTKLTAPTIEADTTLLLNGENVRTSVAVTNVTASKTLALSDKNVEQKLVSGTAATLTIPTNAAVAFSLDSTKIPLRSTGAGTWTIQADTGVLLNGVSGGSCTLDQYKAAVLCKDGTNSWTIVGGNSSVA